MRTFLSSSDSVSLRVAILTALTYIHPSAAWTSTSHQDAVFSQTPRFTSNGAQKLLTWGLHPRTNIKTQLVFSLSTTLEGRLQIVFKSPSVRIVLLLSTSHQTELYKGKYTFLSYASVLPPQQQLVCIVNKHYRSPPAACRATFSLPNNQASKQTEFFPLSLCLSNPLTHAFGAQIAIHQHVSSHLPKCLWAPHFSVE